jgi:hypothetical protein
MKRAWIAVAALLSVGFVGWLLFSEGDQSQTQKMALDTRPEAEAGGVPVHAEEEDPSINAGDPAIEPIAATPFKKEFERPEKLVVRVIQSSPHGDILVPMADVWLCLGERKKLCDGWHENWQTTRRQDTNRHGEAIFPRVTGGSWWLTVSTKTQALEKFGDASEISGGVIEVRIAAPTRLQVQLLGEDLPKEVDAGWASVPAVTELTVPPRAGVITRVNWRQPFERVSQRERKLVNAEGVVQLNPSPGQVGRVVVWSSATGHVGWADVPALAAGEEKHIKVNLQRHGVLSARFPVDWPQDANVNIRLLKTGSAFIPEEEQQCKASEAVHFVVAEPGRYVIAATCETSSKVLCASTAVDVPRDAGHVDLGVLEVGPASVELRARFADGLRPEPGMRFFFVLRSALNTDGAFNGWAAVIQRPAAEHTSVVLRGLPSGVHFSASLSLEDRAFGPRSELGQHCTQPRQELLLASGRNDVDLVLNTRPLEERLLLLTAKIAPRPDGAWKTNRGTMHYRVGTSSRGSGSLDLGEGKWEQQFAPGTTEVEVLLTCGDQMLGPRAVQIAPIGDTEVWLDGWKPADEATLNAALARFAPPHLTKSQR